MLPAHCGALQGQMSTSLPAVLSASAQSSLAQEKHLQNEKNRSGENMLLFRPEEIEKKLSDHLNSVCASKPEGGGGGQL